jgi:hypothetical protein
LQSVCSKCFICFRRKLQKALFRLQVFHEQAQMVPMCAIRSERRRSRRYDRRNSRADSSRCV